MKFSLSEFHLLCFVLMTFSHSLYVSSPENVLLSHVFMNHSLSLNKQLFVLVFSILLWNNRSHWRIMAVSNFSPLLFIRNRVDVAQNLQGLSYEVCSASIATILHTRIIYSNFWDMRHYTPTACCYVTRIYKIRLYLPPLTKHGVKMS